MFNFASQTIKRDKRQLYKNQVCIKLVFHCSIKSQCTYRYTVYINYFINLHDIPALKNKSH